MKLARHRPKRAGGRRPTLFFGRVLRKPEREQTLVSSATSKGSLCAARAMGGAPVQKLWRSPTISPFWLPPGQGLLPPAPALTEIAAAPSLAMRATFAYAAVRLEKA